MDILAHGLWSAGAARGFSFPPRSPKKTWLAVFWGIAPDLFSFGIFTVFRIFSHMTLRPSFMEGGVPRAELVPQYVYSLYNVTHSAIVFAVVFGIVWLFYRRPAWEMLAWPLHILFDIFTHSVSFFPTPFLWPIASVRVDGSPWSDGRFMIANYSLLLIVWLGILWREKTARVGAKEKCVSFKRSFTD